MGGRESDRRAYARLMGDPMGADRVDGRPTTGARDLLLAALLAVHDAPRRDYPSRELAALVRSPDVESPRSAKRPAWCSHCGGRVARPSNDPRLSYCSERCRRRAKDRRRYQRRRRQAIAYAKGRRAEARAKNPPQACAVCGSVPAPSHRQQAEAEALFGCLRCGGRVASRRTNSESIAAARCGTGAGGSGGPLAGRRVDAVQRAVHDVSNKPPQRLLLAPGPQRLRQRVRGSPQAGSTVAAAPPSRSEIAPADHSITSSARASSIGGTSRPSALAVIRLMTKLNLVGCSTGMSAGFAPRRILST